MRTLHYGIYAGHDDSSNKKPGRRQPLSRPSDLQGFPGGLRFFGNGTGIVLVCLVQAVPRLFPRFPPRTQICALGGNCLSCIVWGTWEVFFMAADGIPAILEWITLEPSPLEGQAMSKSLTDSME